jgi:sialate O-acetylesterase
VRVSGYTGHGGIVIRPEHHDVMYLAEPAKRLRLQLEGPWRYAPAINFRKAPPLPQRIATIHSPALLYDGMIAPLLPYHLAGIAWYQGEYNAGAAYAYRAALPALIADWRGRFAQGDLPFLVVQLPNIGEPTTDVVPSVWAELREAQLLTAQQVPRTGLVVTIDIGEAHALHPKDKRDVGERLADAALGLAYGRPGEWTGPLFRAATAADGRMRVAFDHADGLRTADGGLPVGFSLAGADHRFVPAVATIDGNTVVVASPQVVQPVAVRYAWADNPRCNLINRTGLPASPFRSDDWPGITIGKTWP